MQLPYHNTQIKHWNPGAEMPLILPVHLVCNTSDEQIFDNIRINSRRPGKWISLQPEHDGVAVLCGSGPSLKESLGEITERHAAGATIFAMNGAAKFLSANGIFADYQVMIDAREQTADLIGPAQAHLFASQVHPKCFERAPDAQVWHLQIGGIEQAFPDYDGPYALIGGAASVGNTATCLAFTMGFRNLHCYGYDSSHRDGDGHAFHQAMNDGEPCAYVDFNGKPYLTSLTMKLQAEKFQDTARALIASGCHIEVHGDGLLPDIFHAPKETLTECEKYRRMWQRPEYRICAPGESAVEEFLDKAKPTGPIIDFGCGTGRASIKLASLGYDVTLVDFADNCRDDEARHLPFVQADLTQPIPVSASFGFCTDVMEHIPTSDVETVIRNIMASAERVFFQISTIPDSFGVTIGDCLHLTVRPHAWWLGLFTRLGYAVQWQREGEIDSRFLVGRQS